MKQQEYQAKEIFKAAKIVNKHEVPERPKDDAAPRVDGNTVQIQNNPETVKDLTPPVCEAQIVNPKEVMKTTKSDAKDGVENEQHLQDSVIEEKRPNDQLKNLLAPKEPRSGDGARTEKYPEDNIENMNTLNVPAKSGKLQLDEAAQRAQEKPVRAEVIKKPTPIRKEIQP